MVPLALFEGGRPFPPPNHPRYTSWISRMGGPDWKVRGFRRLRSCSHLGFGPFLRPLPGRWGQGPGDPERWDLDTLSYPSRGRVFNFDLVRDVADRSLSAMPNAQRRRNIFASATIKPDRVVRSRSRSGMGSNIA